MKKLVIDARMIEHSGIGTYLQNLIPRILKGPFEVSLIGDPLKLGAFKAAILPCSAKIYSFQEQIALPRIFSSCDLFWSPHFNAPLFPVKAKKRVVTIHDLFHIAFQRSFGILARNWAKILIKNAIHTADSIITVSQFSKSEIVKYFPMEEEKVEVIHLGVDRDFSSMTEDQVRKKYRLPPNFILFVGSPKPHKNINMLLQAFHRLEKEIHLVVVGEGFEMRDSRVHFLGFIPKEDLVSLYHLAKVFVFPSLYEGFGLPPLEAMAANCPVLAARTASIPEVCHDAAYYVDPEDAEDIFKGLSHLLEDDHLACSLRLKGQERVGHFDWEKTAEKHIEVFEKL